MNRLSALTEGWTEPRVWQTLPRAECVQLFRCQMSPGWQRRHNATSVPRSLTMRPLPCDRSLFLADSHRHLNLCSPRFLGCYKSIENATSLPPLLPRFRGACDQRQPPCVDSFDETCVWAMTMLSTNHIGSAVKDRTFFVGLVSNRVYQEFQDSLVGENQQADTNTSSRSEV